MGSKVTWICIVNGITVYLYDQPRKQIDRSIQNITNWMKADKLSEGETRAALARLLPCRTLEEAVGDVELVLESVYEDLELKKNVHAAIGRAAPPQALQASNTSSLLCSPIAEASGRPELFFNMNFSDPRTSRLVELMWNRKTLKSTKKAALGWARQLGLVPIASQRELMGYSMNRIWRAIKKESLFVADIGGTSLQDIDRAWMLNFDMPYGPFALMDMVGLDTILEVEMQYYRANRVHFSRSDVGNGGSFGHCSKAMLFSEHIDSLAAAGLVLAEVWVGKRIHAIDQLGDGFLQCIRDGQRIEILEDGTVAIK